MVGFNAGGGADVMARILADRLSERLGQPVVVQNRPGAAGTIAGSITATAPPDGYTLWLATQGALSVAPFLQSPRPYDPAADFAPISMLFTAPLQLYVKDAFPAKTFKEFVALLKENPDKYFYATAGVGGPGHMFAELLMRETGTKMVHVPFPGDSQAAASILGDVVQIWSTATAAATPFTAEGKVRALVTSGDERASQLPDVPTAKESGYPSVIAYYFNALLAPKGTPPEIVDRLNKAVSEIYNDGKTKDQIVKSLGVMPINSTPAETAKTIQDDIAKWRDVVDQTIKQK